MSQSQLKIARNLDQVVIQSAALRQQATVPAEQLTHFLDLVAVAIDGLQTENSRLFNQLTVTKQGLITALEAANA
jgi:cell division septum initiation protein DivIVA